MSLHFIPFGQVKVIYFRSSVHVTPYPSRRISRIRSARLPLRFITKSISDISLNFQLSPFAAARYSRLEMFAPSFLYGSRTLSPCSKQMSSLSERNFVSVPGF